MASFINTFATQKIYDKIISGAQDRLVFLQPFLKLHPALREALDNLGRPNLDILFVYSLGRLEEQEVAWFRACHYVRVRRCPRLHMRCCLSEQEAFITSRGSYRMDSSSRYDMGFHVDKDQDPENFKEVHDDVYRIVGDSREAVPSVYRPRKAQHPADDLISDWVIAERMELTIDGYYQLLISDGYLLRNEDNKLEITPKGVKVGGKATFSKKYGPYFVWPRESS